MSGPARIVVIGTEIADAAVVLEDGSRLPFDSVLIATGSRAGQLDHLGSAHVFTLRTAQDVAPLYEDIRRTGSLLVIGGGLIGCEAAATARGLGAQATVLEAAPAPLSRIAPQSISSMYSKMHAGNGVEIHTDVSITRLDELDDGTLCATAEDGRTWSAGTVLVAVGSVPCIELAAASGIETGTGVLVGTDMQTSRPNIFAAGDAAEVPNWIRGGTYRSEHWNGALNQAMAAAQSMLGAPVVSLEVPWGWSTQYGVNLQFAGWTSANDEYVVRGSITDRHFTAFALHDDRLVGAIGVGRPKDIRAARRLIADRSRIDRELLAEDSVELLTTAVH